MENDAFLEIEDVFRKIMKKMPAEWKKHSKLEFTRSESIVLHNLYYDGEQRASELAAKLTITTGGLTGLSDKLVEGGYIERKRSDHDRRVVYLSITDKGEEAIQDIFDVRKSFIERLFNDISHEELMTFKETAYKLLGNMDDTNDTDA